MTYLFFTIFANENYNEFINKKIGGTIMKQTREAFEAKNLEYETSIMRKMNVEIIIQFGITK